MQVRGVHGDKDGDWAGQSIGIMAQALTPLSRGGGGPYLGPWLTWNHSKIVQAMDYFYSDFTCDEEIVVACFLSFFLLFLYTEADKALGETCTAIKSFTDWAIVSFK